MRAAVRWIALIVLLSGAGMLAGQPGTAAYVLSALMLAAGVVAGAVVMVVTRFSRRE